MADDEISHDQVNRLLDILRGNLPNDDGVVGKSSKKRPETEGAYRWLEQPGIYCDHYSAQAMSDQTVRIAFAEYIGKDYYPIYRTAVVMPLRDVKSIIRTLTKIVEEVEAKKAPKPKPGEASTGSD